MAYEQRDNSGSLFKNNKPRNEKSPQFQGKAMIGGVMHFFDAWQKKTSNGETYFSCSFKAMEQVKQKEVKSSATTGDDFDSDIPF